MSEEKQARFKVVFPPAGWPVVDTEIAREPIAQFGLGPDEYRRACAATVEHEQRETARSS